MARRLIQMNEVMPGKWVYIGKTGQAPWQIVDVYPRHNSAKVNNRIGTRSKNRIVPLSNIYVGERGGL